MADIPEIVELPVLIGRWAGEVPKAALSIASASIDSATGASLPRGAPRLPAYEVLLLRRVAFTWRLELVVSEERVWFFFFRRKDSPDLSVRAALKIALEMSQIPSPGRGIALSPPELGVPPFLRAATGDDEFVHLAPAGARRDNTLLLQLAPGDQQTLALTFPADGRARGKYSFGARQVELSDEETWLLEPFFALLEVMRAWALAGFACESSSALRFRPGGPGPEVRVLVESVARALSEAVDGLDRAEDGTPSAMPWKRFAADLSADVSIPLDDRGELAEADDDDPFELALKLSFAATDRLRAVRVDLAKLDFLVDGELHGKLIDALLTAENIEEIAEQTESAEAWVRRALESLRTSGVVMRVRRDGHVDTEWFIAPAFQLIVEEQVVVTFGESGVVDRVTPEHELRVMFSTLGEKLVIEDGAVEPFLRMLEHFARWWLG